MREFSGISGIIATDFFMCYNYENRTPCYYQVSPVITSTSLDFFMCYNRNEHTWLRESSDRLNVARFFLVNIRFLGVKIE